MYETRAATKCRSVKGRITHNLHTKGLLEVHASRHFESLVHLLKHWGRPRLKNELLVSVLRYEDAKPEKDCHLHQ